MYWCAGVERWFVVDNREIPLKVKVLDVPDEGAKREWTLPVEFFDKGLIPFSVTRPVEVVVSLLRVGETVNVDGHVSCALGLECSRCLKHFELLVEDGLKAVFMGRPVGGQTGNEVEINDGDIDVQFYDGEELDIYGPLHDLLVLAVPMRPLCREGCEGLCPVCGKDLNSGNCGCPQTVEDPRFSALKQLKFD